MSYKDFKPTKMFFKTEFHASSSMEIPFLFTSKMAFTLSETDNSGRTEYQ